MAGAGAILAGSAYVRLYADQNEYVRGLRVAEQKLHAFGNAVGNIGKRMMALSAAAAAPIAISARTFAAFQDQLLAVQAVSQATREEFIKLYSQAKQLGASTSFTAIEVGAGQINLARQGFSPDDIEAAIPGILDIARATGTDLARAADIAAGTLRAFNMQAKEMPRVVDVLTATANASAQTLEDLGDSMAYVAPIAYEYGLSLEQTAKAVGVLANMQIKGSMAGTALRQIMLRLSDPAIQKNLQGLGIAAVDANKNLRPLGDIMIEIGQAMAKMGTSERLALAGDLFDQRAAGAGLKLATADFPALSDAIDNAAGSARRAAEVMDSGLGGAFRMLMSAIEGVQIAIGEALADELIGSMETLQKYATATAEWVKQNKDVVVTILEVVAVVGVASAAIIAIGATIKGLEVIAGAGAFAITALGTAFTFLLAHPVVAAIAGITTAIAGVTAAVVALSDELDELDTRASQVATANATQRKTDREKFARLEELKQQYDATGKLSKDEQWEIEEIRADLTPRYGRLGIDFSRGTGAGDMRFGSLDEARENFARKLREKEIADLEAVIEEENKHITAATESLGEAKVGSEEANKLHEEIKAREIRRKKLQDKLTLARGKQPDGIEWIADQPIGLDYIFADVPTPKVRTPEMAEADKPLMSEKEAERKAEELTTRINELRISAIEDAYERDIALVNARYDEEEKRAKGLQDVLDQLAEARSLALEQVEAEHDKRWQKEAERVEKVRKQATQSIQDQIARQKIENIWAAQLPGDDANAAELDIQRRKALLEQERKEALRDAEAIGLDPEQVNKLFDMRLARIDIDAASAARAATRSPTGSFSAQAAVLSGLGGKTEDKAVKATKEVKRTIEDGNETLADIRDEVKRGGGMAP
jgi:TP901 family phage tail tape measure protein